MSDVPMLAARLAEAIRYARTHAELTWFPLGLFGASTGAAAALVAAAEGPHHISAIVSRGLNADACDRLACVKRLEIVAGASHLFEEPGVLDAVAALAGCWFRSHFRAVRHEAVGQIDLCRPRRGRP